MIKYDIIQALMLMGEEQKVVPMWIQPGGRGNPGMCF